MIQLIGEFWKEGKFFMWPILFVLGISLAIIIERIVVLIRYRVNSVGLWKKVRDLVVHGRIQEAVHLCKKSAAPLPRILSSGLSHFNKPEKKIQNAVDEVMLEIVPELEKRTGHLTILANIATLTGLLGTIFGLREAFTAVSIADPADKAQMLAQGISQALNTTAFGLLVAVPVLLAYSFIQAKITQIIDDVDQFSVKLINLLGERASGDGS